MLQASGDAAVELHGLTDSAAAADDDEEIVIDEDETDPVRTPSPGDAKGKS